MEKILNEILRELKELKTNQTIMQSDVNKLQQGQNKTNERLDRIEKKLDAVYDQTANLTEFKTNAKLDKISDDIDFLKHEEYQTKQDIFKIKKNFEIIK
ncbi:hypothetical protein [Paramaledivibacter caminithermalis]|jgi:tetrahydromethanopterin S-methyltransferase subunit G|uniref:Uncharacterized protein n=1 Tax=Paramaledivibacter caminithermalis (strain DSM 15212 / CIP 107654 / DViRD3) TaxID=1121301 RepID=A0A1M6TE22_PARC5|nr:hypothetical protein [Paramaledivibacter caminithermalis]SHK55086.1 hypothetical protein SAMN02745912_03651 [Paramaledivibacter caminithermalis DSM 15212]